jgi:hypothetical protein
VGYFGQYLNPGTGPFEALQRAWSLAAGRQRKDQLRCAMGAGRSFKKEPLYVIRFSLKRTG